MNVIELKYLSEEYYEAVELRNKILREPIGLEFTDDDLKDEKNAIHLGCYLSQKEILVGACFLTPLTDVTMKLRQMAVDNNYQKIGIGSNLISYAEKLAVEKSYKYMYLHARKEAFGFYQKLGYEREGEEFIEVGIPHYEMQKKID